MTLSELNLLPRYRAEEEFLKCYNSKPWARAMARRRPFANLDRLLKTAGEIWRGLDPDDREAGPGSAEDQHQLTLWRLRQLFPL